MRQLSASLRHLFKQDFEVYGQTLSKSIQFSTMGDDSPSPTPTFEARGREKSSKEDKNTTEVRTSTSQNGGKKSLASKDSASEESSNVTLNAAALGPVIAEALKSSFEGLRDSMNTGFTGLGDLIASHADEEPDDGNDDGDSNGSKDDGEALVEGEPPAKKGRLDEPEKNRHTLISKLTKTLQLTEHVGPAIDGDLASLVDKIMREKASEDKITDLKKTTRNSRKLLHLVRDKGQSRCMEQFG